MKQEVKTVVVGTLGAGYAARLHGSGYQRVSGIRVRLKTVCDVQEQLAEQVKEQFGYEEICTDYAEMLADPEIDVIDIVTPPFNHVEMAVRALRAGKHVICEKPLTGYFGERGEENVGFTEKALMYKKVLESMEELKKATAIYRASCKAGCELSSSRKIVCRVKR